MARVASSFSSDIPIGPTLRPLTNCVMTGCSLVSSTSRGPNMTSLPRNSIPMLSYKSSERNRAPSWNIAPNSLRAWYSWRSGQDAVSMPSTRTLPRSGRTRPTSALRNTVLPVPDGPSMTLTSPAGKDSETSCQTTWLPNDFVSPSTTTSIPISPPAREYHSWIAEIPRIVTTKGRYLMSHPPSRQGHRLAWPRRYRTSSELRFAERQRDRVPRPRDGQVQQRSREAAVLELPDRVAAGQLAAGEGVELRLALERHHDSRRGLAGVADRECDPRDGQAHDPQRDLGRGLNRAGVEIQLSYGRAVVDELRCRRHRDDAELKERP